MLREELIGKVREKTAKAKKMAWHLRSILIISEAGKLLRETEVQSTIFIQGVRVRDLMRLISAADGPHSQTRGKKVGQSRDETGSAAVSRIFI